MPAARAVLRDIADIGLDPRIAHTRCAHDGRLMSPIVIASPTVQEEKALEEVVATPEITPESHVSPEPEEATPVDKKEEKPPVVEQAKKVVRPRRPA